jgi:predicted transcriptional regulator of viral defense system
MVQTITSLSTKEAEFLSKLAASGRVVFTREEMTAVWPKPAQARRSFHDMERAGWLKRIQRGLYAIIPLSAGPERQWSENPLVVASYLVRPAAVAYWSALHYWNLTEQTPRTVFVQSPTQKDRKQMVVAGVRYHFVVVKPDRFFGCNEQVIEGTPVQITDREKTIIDACDRPDLSGGVWQLVLALQRNAADLDWRRLDEYACRFASGAVFKRLGYLVETLDIPIPDRENLMAGWQQKITTGIAMLDPGEPGQGVTQRRWRICDNIGLRARSEQ